MCKIDDSSDYSGRSTLTNSHPLQKKGKNNAKDIIIICLIAALSILLIVEAYDSLKMRVIHDTAVMLYAGYLIDVFHMVPYKDFYEQNMIGTFLFHSMLGKITGYKNLNLRFVELFIIALLMVNTFFVFKKINFRLALFTGLMMGYAYFGYIPHISLQREIFILALLSCILPVHSYIKNTVIRLTLISLILGLCITIKPHSGIMYPFVLFMIFKDAKKTGLSIKSLILRVSISLVCFSAPILLMLLYLQANGALLQFFDLAANYWKLYAHLDKHVTYREGMDRIAYLIKEFFKFGDNSLLLIPVYFGYRFTEGNKSKSIFLFIGCFTAAFVIYPVFSGQFFPYHVFISYFFMLQLAITSLVPLFTGKQVRRSVLVGQSVILVSILLYVIPASVSNTILVTKNTSRLDRVEKMVEYLRSEQVSKHTRVQALDWTGGGAVHAMLITGVRPGTKFLLDFFFYHNISDPYILKIRKEFITEIYANKPDYLIQVRSEDKPWARGKDTSREFVELNEFVNRYYIPGLESTGFTIFKLKK